MSYLTLASEDEEPVVKAARPSQLQKSLESQVQRHRISEARLQERKCFCLCCGAAVAMLVSLLVYLAFSILTYKQPYLETIMVVVTTRSVPNTTDGEDKDGSIVAGRLVTVKDEPDNFTGDATDGQLRLLKGLEYFCGTEECSRYAAFLSEQLDPSHSPCRNLYDHVCSRWQRNHEEVSSQEMSRGSFAVQDAIVEEFRNKLVRLLLSDDFPYKAVRRFFLHCVWANLTNWAELKATMSYVRPHGSFSTDAVATAIVEMARIGVSPFFSVSVTRASNDTFRVELSAPTPVQHIGIANKYVAHYSKPASNQTGELGYKSSASTKFSQRKNTSIAFLALLERKLCSEVSQAAGGKVNNCSLSDSSRMSPPWNLEWYSTIGMSLLVREVKRQLYAVWLGLSDRHVGEGPSPRDPERLNACLSLIGRHDPYVLSYLLETPAFPATVVKNANYILLALQNMVSQKLGNSSMSFSLGVPRAFQSSATLSQYHSDLYGGPSDVPTLLRLLRNSTWKRWVGQLDAPRDAFAASAYRSKVSGSTVVVPLTLFNATALSDPWLMYLSLATTVTRILRTVFSTEDLYGRLSKSRLAKCLPLSSPLYQSPRSPVPLEHGARKESGADLTELAGLYGAFHFYRHFVGSGQAVPGTDLSSDLLFLLYYVYSLCDALAVGVQGQRAASEDMLRDKVRILAQSFAAVLFPTCEAAEGIEGCDVENENLFLLNRNA